MFKTLCILLALTVILCGCTTHQQSNTFKNLRQPPTSEVKTYTYKEACDLSKDSDGNYNFFLLPGINPDQAYTFERKLAKEWGFGYNVYTGAHPYTVEALVNPLVRGNIPVELLEAYIATLVANLQAEEPDYSTFRTAITYYLALRKAIQMPAMSLYNQMETERALLGLLIMLEDNHRIDVERRIDTAWRLLDRVKFHVYKSKKD
ncbi:hypothetical protein C6503_05925 [Candidatus Poribacteria bacterium]|nr:MAG: hypothetical protein C6503_05925 [Candidatus Poribacteria bacterium]